jgi:DNA mismatch repair protein MutL
VTPLPPETPKAQAKAETTVPDFVAEVETAKPSPAPAASEKAPPRQSEPTPKAVAQPKPNPVPQPQPEPEQTPEAAPEPEVEALPWVIRGELFHTYVMVEQGDKVLLIDKHAAHERANFDRLKAADYQPMVQELLTPVTFTPAPEERAILLEQAELLSRFGFEVEEFGSAALAVRSAPDYVDAGDIEAALLELAQRIRTAGTADPAATRDELLHTMACKAAIKGGQKNGQAELEEVAQMVMSGQVKYCPHGRPVAIELTKYQLEKQFKRA